MGKSSSTKRAAKLASRSKGAKVRTQRSLLFPVTLVSVLVLGTLLVAYARASRPSEAAQPPTVDDHWHAAFGIYDCGAFTDPVTEPEGTFAESPVGIQPQSDGLIHIQPTTEAFTGAQATFGVFLAAAGITLTEDTLRVPALDLERKAGDGCGGKPGSLKVMVWDDATETAKPKIFITDFDRIRFTRDGMAFTIAFVNADADLSTLKPPNVAALANPADRDGAPATTAPATTAPATTTG